ncbi:6-bladed beta-propeller [Algoriphagus taiwanensis]|uniref:TolB-like 6-blade propeller-like n=1 Tax=Algoriphagus taiwanensis TaxID=1445656 RepID=A0ABQ6PY20_9BACT|nr:hypothetical protein Ataiwa_04920 [Algoriphagus taiwanensis]
MIQKTTFRVVSILIFIIFSISCKESEELTIPIEKLTKKASFFNDSSDEFFLVNPSDMFQLNDKIFIAEAELSHLAIFDLNFKFIKTVGRFGEGPDDFFYLGEMGKTPEGLLYLHDRGHELLRLFDSDGVEKKRISVPESLYSKNFIFTDNSICFSVVNGQKPFGCFDFNGQKTREFGDFLNSYHNDFQRNQRSIGALYRVGKSSYIKILPTESEISLLDSNDVKIDSVDIFSIPIFTSYKNKVSQFYSKNSGKSFISVFKDHYLHDDKLYLLTYSSYLDVEGNEQVNTNKVVVLDVTSDRITINSVLDLSSEVDVYSQILIFDGFIHAFDKEGGKLDQFEIP